MLKSETKKKKKKNKQNENQKQAKPAEWLSEHFGLLTV